MEKPFWEHYTDPIPDELIAAIKQDRLVAFIGSGVSRRCLSKTRAPLPDWSSLLRDLIAWGTERSLIGEKVTDDLNDLLARREYLMVAQECRELLGDEQLAEFISIVFDPDGIVPARVHDLLASVPFYGYVTTNYDNLLERAHVRVHNRQFRTVSPDNAREFFLPSSPSRPLLKLHGDIDIPASIVLGHRDYRRLMWDPEYQTFVRQLLTEYTLLFVGYGLSDIDLLMPLDQLVEEGVTLKHYRLSRRGERNKTEKKRLLLDRHIETLEYVDHFGFHNHVDTFLEGLLIASDNQNELSRVRMELRARISIHYAPEDEEDGLFVWHYVFREGAITQSEEPQSSQWQHLEESLAEGLPALDHLVFLIKPQSLRTPKVVEIIEMALKAARDAGVLVVFLAVGFVKRPCRLAEVAPTSPIFLLKESFSELDLEPFRQFLTEDIKGGYRQQ